MISSHVYSAYLIGDPDVQLGLLGGQIALDDTRAPHVEGDIEVAWPGHWEVVPDDPPVYGGLVWVRDDDVLAALDPKLSPRVRVEVDGEFPSFSVHREFDLGVRVRVPDQVSRRVHLQLASDEAMLEDYAPLADDSQIALASSLRDVVNYVIGEAIPAATLEASPAVDADVTPIWAVTNLIVNPSFETNTAGANASTGSSALGSVVPPVPPPLGTRALRWTAAAGANALLLGGWDGVSATKTARVRPGAIMTASVYLLSSVARSAFLRVGFRDENGTSMPVTFESATAPTSASEWTRYVVTFRVPANAQYAYLIANSTGNSAGQFHYADAVMLHEGAHVSEPFDGGSTDATYLCAWAGTAHASTSSRTPLVDGLDPDALVWHAGDSALKFLQPLLQARGLRLVCDETRAWTLRDESYAAPSALDIRYAVNLIEGSDIIDRDAGLWRDGRVIEYVWTDADGIEQRRIDSYALTPNPTKVDKLEIRSAYPGPGRAEYSVRRAQGRGREVTATRVAEWNEHAEQPITIRLDGALIQTGKTSRVVFDLGPGGSRDRVTVTTRSTDTPEGAIDLLAGTIDSLVGTINDL